MNKLKLLTLTVTVILSLIIITFFILKNTSNHITKIDDGLYNKDNDLKNMIIQYLQTNDIKYLKTILNNYDLNKINHKIFINYAKYKLYGKLPEKLLNQAQIFFIDANKDKIISSAFKQKELTKDNNDLYVEGLFKMLRGGYNYKNLWLLDFLELKEGNFVADIGYGDGMFLLEIANKVGISGKAIGIEIAPSLVDFINFTSKKFDIKQLTAKLGTNDSITLEANTLDIAFCKDVFSNLRGDILPWIESIYKSLKKNGKFVVMQHYSDNITDEEKTKVNLLLTKNKLFQNDKLPSLYFSPKVIIKICEIIGFELQSVNENINYNPQFKTYCIIFKK